MASKRDMMIDTYMGLYGYCPKWLRDKPEETKMKLRLKDEKTGDLYDVDELSAKKVRREYDSGTVGTNGWLRIVESKYKSHRMLVKMNGETAMSLDGREMRLLADELRAAMAHLGEQNA